MPRDNRAPATATSPPSAETGGPIQLGPVWGTLACYVPPGTDRRALARRLADQLLALTRPATGATYPAAVDVFVPAGMREHRESDHDVPVLFIQAWAERPWQRDREWRNVFIDLSAAVTAWMLDHYPVPPGKQPTMMPLPPRVGERLNGISEFVAHAADALPPGWAESLDKHRPQ